MNYKPKSIIIAGIEYQIQYCAMEDFGEFLSEKRIIRIRKNLSEEERFYTILHECVHAVLHLTGQAYVIGDIEKEEGVVRAIENLFFPVFEDELREYRVANGC